MKLSPNQYNYNVVYKIITDEVVSVHENLIVAKWKAVLDKIDNYVVYMEVVDRPGLGCIMIDRRNQPVLTCMDRTGLLQDELAKKLKITQATLRNWLKYGLPVSAGADRKILKKLKQLEKKHNANPPSFAVAGQQE